MILTPPQVKTFEKAVAAAASVLQKIEFLEKLAEADPNIRERVETAKAQHHFLSTLATLALDLNDATRVDE